MKLKKSKLGEFVPVKKGNQIFYGGHQEDLKYKNVAKFYRDRSCVVTAFTNVYLYLYKKDEVFSLDQFNDYQYLFYKIIKPKIYGVPTAKILDFKLNKLRKYYNINLKAHFLTENLFRKVSLEEKAHFIESALDKDLPLIFFNWSSSSIKLTRHHGLVITEIEKSKKDKGDYLLTLSSWGKKYVISLRDFSKQIRTYTGFVYFERLDNII